MPLALVIAGVLLLVSAVRGTQVELVQLVKGDLIGTGKGEGNFLQWMLALVLVGAIGYIPRLKPLSVALLALILLVIFLRKGQGFFAQITAATGLQNNG